MKAIRLRFTALPQLLALVLLLYFVPTAAAQRATGYAHRVTYADMEDAFPSRDGQWLVYSSTFMGHEQLFVMKPDGSSVRQLTRDDADHESPSFSPDGKKIAYVLIKNNHSVIYMMNADGTAQERLSPEDAESIHPMWAPDGRSIIYCADDDLHPPKKNPSQIFTLDLATKQPKPIISGGVNTYPSWSPDGKKVLFRRMVGEMNSEVFVADPDGSEAVNLTSHQAFDGWPDWSPDGKRIAFASNRHGHGYEIFVMNSDGSNVKLLANTDGRATSPRWSPDGSKIYFTNCSAVDLRFDCHIYTVEAPPA